MQNCAAVAVALVTACAPCPKPADLARDARVQQGIVAYGIGTDACGLEAVTLHVGPDPGLPSLQVSAVLMLRSDEVAVIDVPQDDTRALELEPGDFIACRMQNTETAISLNCARFAISDGEVVVAEFQFAPDGIGILALHSGEGAVRGRPFDLLRNRSGVGLRA